MICFNCGKKIEDNSYTCPYCNITLKSNIKVIDNTKSINKYGKITIGIFLVIILITLIVILVNGKYSIKEKNKLVEQFCKEGEYKENVTLSSVIDNFECPSYVSYMIDTSGSDLTSNNIDDLIKISNGLIYETYYYFNNNDISYIYDKPIYEETYYSFLYNNDLCGVKNEKEYRSLIYESVIANNIGAYKGIIKCMDKEKYTFYNIETYFGVSYAYQNSSSIKLIKEVSKEPLFFQLYKKYYDEDAINFIMLFNSELFKSVTDEEDLSHLYLMLLRNLNIVDYEDILNYHEYGGRFYTKGEDPIYELMYSLRYNVNDVEKKLKYIIENALKEGYDPTYSTALDYLIGHLKNTSQNKAVYKILKSYNYRCYRNCAYERNFK